MTGDLKCGVRVIVLPHETAPGHAPAEAFDFSSEPEAREFAAGVRDILQAPFVLVPRIRQRQGATEGVVGKGGRHDV